MAKCSKSFCLGGAAAEIQCFFIFFMYYFERLVLLYLEAKCELPMYILVSNNSPIIYMIAP